MSMSKEEYLSKVEEEVLSNHADGAEVAVVPILDYFTIEDVTEIMRRIHYFKFFRNLSNTKALPISKVVHIDIISVQYKLRYELYFVIRWN